MFLKIVVLVWVQAAATTPNQNFLDKLVTGSPASPLEWLLWLVVILFYGQIALLITIWAIFSFDLFVNIVGLGLLAMIAAFVISRNSRPIALVVMASLNFFLGTGLTVASVAGNGVPIAALLSIITLIGVLAWAVGAAVYKLRGAKPA